MPGSWRTSVLAVTSCFAMSLMPLVADAAGLGRLTVFSALGQPLRAEIEVTATREELSGMKAQLAPRAAFRQAGIDLSGTVQGISFSIEKRPDGQNIIRLSSNQPISDPFLDMLIELNWSSGRMVREYTFLLDPPEIAAKTTAAPIAVTTKAQVAPVSSSTATTYAPSPSTGTLYVEPSLIDDETRSRALQATQGTQAAMPEPVREPIREVVREPVREPVREAQKTAAPVREPEKLADHAADGRLVKPGDTLSKIAQATKPEGVTLDQMLVGLLRANQEAFDGGNMNRLRSGRILTIPEKSEIEAVAPEEARKVVTAQATDWNAYRARLAGLAAKAPATERDARQASAGKITAKVEEKALPESALKDQVKVSKSDTGTAAGAPGKRSDEDEIAKQKAMREAKERAAALEKNVANLQKLLDVKDQTLADAQKQAAKPAPEKPVAAAPEKPAEPPKAAEPAKSEPVPAAAPATPVPAVAAAPAPAPVPAPAPADDMPKPKPKPAAAEVPPPEPSFLDALLEDPLVPAGGAGVMALLAAFLVMRRRRAAKAPEAAPAVTVAAPVEPVPPAELVPAAASLAPEAVVAAEPDVVEEEEVSAVDPIAEADVYLAYGRDGQAEEILRDAQAREPERLAIALKLLEIYAQRKDAGAFEREAVKLRDATNGIGADWESAAALGLALDPSNPLYGGTPEVAAESAVAPEVVELTPAMPEPVEEISFADAAPAESAQAEALSEPIDLKTLDFDLGPVDAVEAPPSPVAETSSPAETAAASVDVAPLDFDLPAAAPEAPAEAAPTALDFSLPDLDLKAEASAPESAAESAAESALEPTAPAAPVEEDPGLDFSLNFDALAPAAPAEVAPAAPAPADEPVAFNFDLSEAEPPSDAIPAPAVAPFDMSSITLELDEDKPAATIEVVPSPEVDPLAAEEAEPIVADLPDLGVVAPTAAEELPEIEFAPAAAPAVPEELAEPENEEAATKLDLAKAYEEMGDLEGARELLGEVLEEGNAGQRTKARALLDKIGA